MRRFFALGAVGAVFLLSACKPEEVKFTGYVEGEFVYVSPTSSGNLARRDVSRGDEVAAGDPLFSLDTANLEASLAQAAAEVGRAEAAYRDLTKGRRPEEIDVIRKRKAQAEANLAKARKEYERGGALVANNDISRADFDSRTAAFKALEARVQELAAELKVATLGAREDEIEVARNAVGIARQKAVRIEKDLRDAAPPSPVSGRVEDTFYDAGEFVSAGSAVVSLLPPENVKDRVFASQKGLPSFRFGQEIGIGCDGCPAGMKGKITFISSRAEFTPPVIYSVESRQKLVFMIEALPARFEPALRPGLPVDVVPE